MMERARPPPPDPSSLRDVGTAPSGEHGKEESTVDSSPTWRDVGTAPSGSFFHLGLPEEVFLFFLHILTFFNLKFKK
jgi:hypothetical protein